jgi:SAM-dependent methyltransferase
MGSANGEELTPVLPRARRVTILEAAEGFAVTELRGVPVRYIKPDPLGVMPFDAHSFDLVTCLGVLHHIANVSTVLRELYRCMLPGGHVLLREPIRSMGDWRQPRRGLTPRERGIPLHLLRKAILGAGFSIVREAKCMFSLTARLRYLLSSPVYNSPVVVRLDGAICRLPFWSGRYHPESLWDRPTPSCVYYVLQKPGKGLVFLKGGSVVA